jgi:hypothetical protein
MKGIISVFLITTLLCFVARGQESNKTSQAHSPEYPITGMTAMDLSNCLSELKYKLPVGLKIISIYIFNEKKVNVTLGRIDGPLAGHGEVITFELKEGKWVATQKSKLVS